MTLPPRFFQYQLLRSNGYDPTLPGNERYFLLDLTLEGTLDQVRIDVVRRLSISQVLNPTRLQGSPINLQHFKRYGQNTFSFLEAMVLTSSRIFGVVLNGTVNRRDREVDTPSSKVQG